jgi:hypothetical protein
MYRELMCLLSLCLKLSSGESINSVSSSSWVIFELIVTIMMYLRASELYVSIRLISYSLYYEYHSKICDLIITLFIILNFIVSIALARLSSCSWSLSWDSKRPGSPYWGSTKPNNSLSTFTLSTMPQPLYSQSAMEMYTRKTQQKWY